MFSLTTVGAHQMEELAEDTVDEEVVNAEIVECPLGTTRWGLRRTFSLS